MVASFKDYDENARKWIAENWHKLYQGHEEDDGGDDSKSKADNGTTLPACLRGFVNFLKMIGDYESLVICHERRPRPCPSMNVASLIRYVLYRSYEPDENSPHQILRDSNGRLVLDAFGNTVCRHTGQCYLKLIRA